MSDTPAKRRFWKQGWFIVAAATIVPILAAGVLAAVFCKAYWGYVLAPPGVDPRVLGATRVVSKATVGFPKGDANTAVHSGGAVDLDVFRFVRSGDGAVRLIGPRVDAARWRDDWVRRGVMPSGGSVPEMSSGRCRELPALIEATADLARGAYGDGFPDVRAQIDAYELLGPKGERLLYVVLSTGPLSNDHLAYYELLYDDSVSPARLLDRRHWCFDVAGLEALEFVSCTISVSALLLTFVLPATLATLAYRRFSKAARVKRGVCPACGYDLKSAFDRGCPECAWGTGTGRAEDLDLQRYRLGGRCARALTRAPGWRTLAALGAGALLTWYARSMPGGTPWATSLGPLLFWGAALVAAIKLIAMGIAPRAVRARSGRRYGVLRFAIAGMLVALTLVGAQREWPLHWRFSLSRPALERAVGAARTAGFPSPAPVGMDEVVGLFVVGGIVRTTDGANGVIVWVGEAGGRPVRRSFVWYADGPPATPSAYGAPIKLFRQVDPGWYLWDYAPRTRR